MKNLKTFLVLSPLFFLFSFFITLQFLSPPPTIEKEVIVNQVFVTQPPPKLSAMIFQASELGYQEKKELNLNYALTPTEWKWGLMGGQSLQNNEGLGFIFPEKAMRKFWMYNVNQDLSLAYLDDNKVIREIYDLKAYPEKYKKSTRKIKTVQDLYKLSDRDPDVLFFKERAQRSSFPSRFAFEVQQGWFQDNQVKVGDVLQFETDQQKGFILSSIDFSKAYNDKKPSLIEFPTPDHHPLHTNKPTLKCRLVFLDEKDTVKEIFSYDAKVKTADKKSQVVQVNFPYKKVVIFPENHHLVQSLTVGAPLYLSFEAQKA